jgi:uncharacterized protein YukE
MSDVTYAYNPNSLGDAPDQLLAFAQIVIDHVRGLYSHDQQALAGWSDSSKFEYEKRRLTWNATADDMARKAGKAAEGLRDILGLMEQTERTNAAAFGG